MLCTHRACHPFVRSCTSVRSSIRLRWKLAVGVKSRSEQKGTEKHFVATTVRQHSINPARPACDGAYPSALPLLNRTRTREVYDAVESRAREKSVVKHVLTNGLVVAACPHTAVALIVVSDAIAVLRLGAGRPERLAATFWCHETHRMRTE